MYVYTCINGLFSAYCQDRQRIKVCHVFLHRSEKLRIRLIIIIYYSFRWIFVKHPGNAGNVIKSLFLRPDFMIISHLCEFKHDAPDDRYINK
jgi:hypothetical protein